MQGKQIFEYAFIRFVPKVEREEFLNIGVILFSRHKAFLDVKFHLDEDRLISFSPDIEIELISKYLKSWKLICEGDLAGGKIAELDKASRFRWLTAARSTIIQHSKVHTGMCDEPDKMLQSLFERYVL